MVKGYKFSLESRLRCRNAQLGRKHPPEVIEKIRKAHIGFKHSPETIEKFKLRPQCQKTFVFTPEHRNKIIKANTGRVTSEEQRKKISEAKKGHPYKHFTQTKSYQRHLIRTSSEYKQFRRTIFIRDDFTCQQCGVRGSYIELHHLKSFSQFPEFRFDRNNVVTLCKECHKKTDNYLHKARINDSAS
jgi:5-methylcytosine-specific restriction endonuclease McrA